MSVALVGAGPGDPELITVRGLKRLRECEVLVYDRLVAEELVDEAPEGALRIARDDFEQDDVNRLLVMHGRNGRRVVRLKGGDPFVFGRGGEEALALADAGIPFELVPGVSSIAAVPESVGIPVTHRGVSSMVTAFAANDVEKLDAAALARMPGHARRLHGRRSRRTARRAADRARPARRHACRRHLVGDDGAGAGRHRAARRDRGGRRDLPTPALVVIGEVVAVREALSALRRSAA